MEEYPFLKEIKKLEIENDVVQIQIYDPKFSYSHLHCENSGQPFTINRCLVFVLIKP
jgi:hypothetical protein